MTPEVITHENPISSYEAERGKPMPSLNHSGIQSTLTGLLWVNYRTPYSIFPELSIKLNGESFTPDICIYPKRKLNWQQDARSLTEAPLTTVEILSPSQAIDTFQTKFAAYFAAGVKSCWLVQPFVETIFIFTPDGKIAVFHEGTLTDPTNGITLDIGEIFAE
jgi:Uma2 family endonuclease